MNTLNMSLFLCLCFFCFSLRAHVFQHYDGFRASKNSARKEGREHGYMPMLDGLALEHMTQDCSFLKNQLLKLKTLLEVRPTFAQMQTQKPIYLLAYLSSILRPITETFVLLNMNSRLRLLFWVLIIHTDCKHCLSWG